MTSKKLGALLRSVPAATAAAEEAATPVQPQKTLEHTAAAVTPLVARISRRTAPEAGIELEVPLQVLIPGNIRRQLAIKAAEEGESLRALVLKAVRGIGIEVTEADIAGKRGRRNS